MLTFIYLKKYFELCVIHEVNTSIVDNLLTEKVIVIFKLV